MLPLSHSHIPPTLSVWQCHIGRPKSADNLLQELDWAMLWWCAKHCDALVIPIAGKNPWVHWTVFIKHEGEGDPASSRSRRKTVKGIARSWPPFIWRRKRGKEHGSPRPASWRLQWGARVSTKTIQCLQKTQNCPNGLITYLLWRLPNDFESCCINLVGFTITSSHPSSTLHIAVVAASCCSSELPIQSEVCAGLS